jgi:DNA topoisomerase-2
MAFFYEMTEYERWKMENNNGKGWRIRLHETLGSFTPDHAKRFFAELERHRIPTTLTC